MSSSDPTVITDVYSSVDDPPPAGVPGNRESPPLAQPENKTRDGTLIICVTVLYFFSLAITVVPIKLLINERIADHAEDPNSASAFVDATSTFLHAAISFLIGRYSSGLGDFVGRKPVLVVSCALFIVSRVLYLSAYTAERFYLGAVIGGMFDCFYFSALAWLSDVYPVEHERSRWVGMYTGIVGGFAFVVGVPTGVVLANRYAPDFPLRLAVILGAICLVATIVLPVDDTIGIKKHSRTGSKSLSTSSSQDPRRVGQAGAVDAIAAAAAATAKAIAASAAGGNSGGVVSLEDPQVDSAAATTTNAVDDDRFGLELRIISANKFSVSPAPSDSAGRNRVSPTIPQHHHHHHHQHRTNGHAAADTADDVEKAKCSRASPVNLLEHIKSHADHVLETPGDSVSSTHSSSGGAGNSKGTTAAGTATAGSTPSTSVQRSSSEVRHGRYIIIGNRGVPDNAWNYLVDKFPISIGTWNIIIRAKYPLDWLVNFTMHCTSALLNLIFIQYCLAIFDWSAIRAAAAILFIGLCLGIFAPILLHRFKPLSVAFRTMCMFTVGLILVSIAGTGMQNKSIVNGIALVGLISLGLGTAWVPALQTNILSQYRKDEQGEISGLLGQQNDISLLPAYIMSLGFTESLSDRSGPVYWPGSAFAAASVLGFLSVYLHWRSYGNTVWTLTKRNVEGSVYVTTSSDIDAPSSDSSEISEVAPGADVSSLPRETSQ